MDIGCREVTRGDNNMVKFLLVEFISGIVMCRGSELSGCIVVNYPADSIVKADPVSAIGFLNPTFYVTKSCCSGRVRGNLFSKMFFKGIIGKF